MTKETMHSLKFGTYVALRGAFPPRTIKHVARITDSTKASITLTFAHATRQEAKVKKSDADFASTIRFATEDEIAQFKHEGG